MDPNTLPMLIQSTKTSTDTPEGNVFYLYLCDAPNRILELNYVQMAIPLTLATKIPYVSIPQPYSIPFGRNIVYSRTVHVIYSVCRCSPFWERGVEIILNEMNRNSKILLINRQFHFMIQVSPVSSLQLCLMLFSNFILMIYDPRLIWQFVCHSPVNTPTEVNKLWITHIADCSTKGDLIFD